MAEAFSSENLLARFREFARLFEHAFEKSFTPVSTMKSVLTKFLMATNLNYDLNEIKEWTRLRGGASHADLRVTRDVFYERDIQHIMPRIEQAAYDVLLNKQEWHNQSITRRQLWDWDYAVGNRDSNLLLARVGKEVKFSPRLIDESNAYFCDLSLKFDFPAHWWKMQDRPQISTRIEVLP